MDLRVGVCFAFAFVDYFVFCNLVVLKWFCCCGCGFVVTVIWCYCLLGIWCFLRLGFGSVACWLCLAIGLRVDCLGLFSAGLVWWKFGVTWLVWFVVCSLCFTFGFVGLVFSCLDCFGEFALE